MKKFILAFAILLLAFNTNAQLDPLYSQYINNPLVLNPAYAGINNIFSANVGYRSQWNGLEGAPSTALVSAHSSFLNNKVGGGLTIIRDEIGTSVNMQINMAGAYKIEFGDNIFSFGMQAGINNYKEDNSQLTIRDPNDALFESNQSFTKINFGAGAILKGSKYYIGLSVPKLMNNTEQIGSIETEIYSRHYYLGAGYVFPLSSLLSLKTSALVKAVSDVPASIDFSASAIILDTYSAGILSRNLETYGLILGMKIKDNLRFGYTFEVPTNKSVGSQFNSHELTLTLDLLLFDAHFMNERYF